MLRGRGALNANPLAAAGQRGLCSNSLAPVSGERARERGRNLKVHIPTPLRSYTSAREVDAHGTTIAELLADLERRYPGIRFRMIDEQDKMRAHMRFFVNGEQVFDMGRPLVPSDSIQIVQALSGG